MSGFREMPSSCLLQQPRGVSSFPLFSSSILGPPWSTTAWLRPPFFNSLPSLLLINIKKPAPPLWQGPLAYSRKILQIFWYAVCYSVNIFGIIKLPGYYTMTSWYHIFRERPSGFARHSKNRGSFHLSLPYPIILLYSKHFSSQKSVIS